MTDEEVLAIVRGSLTRTRDAVDGVHMDRPAAALIARARARRRRRGLSAGVAVGAALAVALLTGILPASGQVPGGTSARVAQARTVADVVSRVQHALANNNLVLSGRMSGIWGNTVAWTYGRQGQFEEFWPVTDHRDRVVHGRRLWDFPPKDRGKPYLVQGTTVVHGKLMTAYVSYFDRRYSLSTLWAPPVSACSKTGALSMGSPPVPGVRWQAFIDATLACGAARVTGHVRVNGMETTKITGKPATVKLVAGEAKAVGQKWARSQWVLYVNPKTYLPIRMYGSTRTFGGPRRPFTSSSTTDVTWLPPTPANIAKTLVTIPPGFHHWRGNPGNQ